MENSKHTPGPWKTIHTQTRTLEWNIGTDLGAPIPAMIVEGLNNRDGNAEANARLIAAAPELLKACKAIWDSGAYGSNQFKAIGLIQQAIAKAEGK